MHKKIQRSHTGINWVSLYHWSKVLFKCRPDSTKIFVKYMEKPMNSVRACLRQESVPCLSSQFTMDLTGHYPLVKCLVRPDRNYTCRLLCHYIRISATLTAYPETSGISPTAQNYLINVGLEIQLSSLFFSRLKKFVFHYARLCLLTFRHLN